MLIHIQISRLSSFEGKIIVHGSDIKSKNTRRIESCSFNLKHRLITLKCLRRRTCYHTVCYWVDSHLLLHFSAKPNHQQRRLMPSHLKKWECSFMCAFKHYALRWSLICKKKQRQYNTGYDRRGACYRTTKLSKLVSFNNPPLRPTLEGDTDAMHKTAYNKLQARTEGPYRKFTTQSHPITMINNSTPKTLSIDPVTLSSKPILYIGKERAVHKDTQTTNTNDSLNAREYVVDNMIRHIGHGWDVEFVVRWYCYWQKDDTVDPSEHLPQQFLKNTGRRKIEVKHQKKKNTDTGLIQRMKPLSSCHKNLIPSSSKDHSECISYQADPRFNWIRSLQTWTRFYVLAHCNLSKSSHSVNEHVYTFLNVLLGNNWGLVKFHFHLSRAFCRFMHESGNNIFRPLDISGTNSHGISRTISSKASATSVNAVPTSAGKPYKYAAAFHDPGAEPHSPTSPTKTLFWQPP